MQDYLQEIADAFRTLKPVAEAGKHSPPQPSQWQCPVCQEQMGVEVYQSISVDVCPQHGVWFDLGEVPALLARVRSSERQDRMSAIREARTNGKISGVLFGALAFLFFD